MTKTKPVPPAWVGEIDLIDLREPFWEQQQGESSLWFRRFCRVRNQIGQRSLLAAYRSEAEEKSTGKPNKALPKHVPGAWKVAQIKYRWEERLKAWDAYQQEKEDQIWDERLKLLREKGWEWVELLIEKAQPMLRMPIVSQTLTSNDGGKVTLTTIEATDWRQYRIPLLMMRQALDIGMQVIGDNNIALTQLLKQGFEVKDPTMASDPSVYLEGLDQGFDIPDFMDAAPDLPNFHALRSADASNLPENSQTNESDN